MEIWPLLNITSRVYRLQRPPRSVCQCSAKEKKGKNSECVVKELVFGEKKNPKASMEWYFKKARRGSVATHLFKVKSGAPW